jgi:predicted nucleotidyltransferase
MNGNTSPPLPETIPELATLDRTALRQAAEEQGLDLIVLFGSTVKGRRRAESDLDIAIHFAGPRREKPTLREVANVEGALFDVLAPRCELDVVPLHGASPLLKWNVAQHGIPLFTATPATWTLFRIHARHDFENNARFRKRQWHRLLKSLGHDTTGR